MSRNRLTRTAEQIFKAGASIAKCWGYIDGTTHRISRPGGQNADQESMYNGRKKIHGVQFQAIMMADEMISSLSNGFPGITHDARMYREFETERRLEELQYPEDDGLSGKFYTIYVDKGYATNSSILVLPVIVNELIDAESAFNFRMPQLRVSIENTFGKISDFFCFIDYHKTQQIRKSPVIQHYIVAAFLVNCRSCIYGNQVSEYFELSPAESNNYISNFC